MESRVHLVRAPRQRPTAPLLPANSLNRDECRVSNFLWRLRRKPHCLERPAP